jgi:hypothetical protein
MATEPHPNTSPGARGGAPGETLAALAAAARERILILDGAMGTQIQGLGLGEADFRGHRFGTCDCHQQGNNDLLILTQPEPLDLRPHRPVEDQDPLARRGGERRQGFAGRVPAGAVAGVRMRLGGHTGALARL